MGLEGAARRFVKFGGGISAEQLAWLEGQLQVGRGFDFLFCFFHYPAAPAALLRRPNAAGAALMRYQL